MNLASGSRFWLSTLPSPPSYPKLEEDVKCDVLIVGGGEAGALCAYYLCREGIDAVLIDKRKISHGSSSANTGLLQFSNDKSLRSMISSFGVDKAVTHYRLCQKGLESLESICKELELQPDFRLRDSLYYASNPSDVEELRKDYATLKEHGFPVEWLDEQEVSAKYSFTKPAALYSRGDAEINPYVLTHSLIQHCHRKKSLRVYEDTKAVHHEADAEGITFITDGKRKIRAKKAILALGYEAMEVKPNKGVSAACSYAIASQRFKEIPSWYERSLIWETARPYLYFRTTVDNRIIIGGLDEAIDEAGARDAMLLHKKELLLQVSREMFPQLPDLKAEYYWAASFYSTMDGLPMFGINPNFPHCYFIMGYGGNGTVCNLIGAELIKEFIMKGSSPYEEIYQLNRPAYATIN